MEIRNPLYNDDYEDGPFYIEYNHPDNPRMIHHSHAEDVDELKRIIKLHREFDITVYRMEELDPDFVDELIGDLGEDEDEDLGI